MAFFRDPMWMVAMACYASHRCWQWYFPGAGWMDSYWNDFLMLPCALPLILWLYGLLGLRDDSIKPLGIEILGHGILWGLMAEMVGPLVFDHSVGDPWDLVAYAAGGLVLYLRWNLKLFNHLSLEARI